MTTLTGIKDAQYLAQFLGKRIAVQDTENKNKYLLYPHLKAIYAQGYGIVVDSQNEEHQIRFDRFENPYVIIMDKEIEIK